MNMELWIFNVMKMENVSVKVQLLVTSVIIVLLRHMIFQIAMVSFLTNLMMWHKMVTDGPSNTLKIPPNIKLHRCVT